MIHYIHVFVITRSKQHPRLRQVMNRLAKAGVALNREKCLLATSSVKFFGVVISTNAFFLTQTKLRWYKLRWSCIQTNMLQGYVACWAL